MNEITEIRVANIFEKLRNYRSELTVMIPSNAIDCTVVRCKRLQEHQFISSIIPKLETETITVVY